MAYRENSPALPGRRAGLVLLFFAGGVLAALFATYWETRNFAFIAADTLTYALHPRVVAPPSLDNLMWLLTHPIDANWTPLSWYSHVIDHQLFGPQSGAHHLSNVAYHTAATFSVFAFLFYATDRFWRSMAVALLFAFHPLRVESVAWVVERKDLLSSLLGAAALLSYTAYTRGTRFRWYGASWLLFVLSLLSKAMLVTLPCLLLVLDFWPLRRFNAAEEQSRGKVLKRVLLEKVAFLLPAIFVAYMARHGVDYNTASHDPLGLGQRLLNAFYSVAQYVRKSFIPSDLSFWYAHPYLEPTGGTGLTWAAILASISLIVLITALCVVNLRKRPYLAAGWLWFLGTLTPVLGIYFQAGRQGMADRFTYFPSIGLAVMVVWSVAELVQSRDERRRRALLASLLAVVVLVLAWRSRQESLRWRDTETIYTDVLAKNPDNTPVHYSLGRLLLERGEVARGLAHLTRAAELTPSWDYLVTGLANELRKASRKEEALYWYRRAYQIAPELNHTRINLATALAEVGQHEEAVYLLKEAVAHNPRSLTAHLNLGATLAAANRLPEARKQLDRALAIDPESPQALRMSARVQAALGDNDEAIARWKRLLAAVPRDAEARAMVEQLRRSPSQKPSSAP